jgi:hypothetical protein
MDAWFDTWSAAPQLPYVESLAMACFVELPLAALLAWTAWRALDWAAPRGRPARSNLRRLAGKGVTGAADVPAPGRPGAPRPALARKSVSDSAPGEAGGARKLDQAPWIGSPGEREDL